jgi:hypothetical protein
LSSWSGAKDIRVGMVYFFLFNGILFICSSSSAGEDQEPPRT